MKNFFSCFKEYWVPLLVTIVLLVTLAVASTFINTKNHVLQPNTFFFEDRPRFLYVDEGEVTKHKNGTVIVDRVTGVLYLYMEQDNTMCPLYNSDGTIIVIDIN